MMPRKLFDEAKPCYFAANSQLYILADAAKEITVTK